MPQVDERDCGLAALAMVLAAYGSRLSLAHLRQLAKTDATGTTALGLVKAAQALGLKTQAIKADASLLAQTDLQFPFIVHVLKQGKLLHYYTVFRVKGDKLLIGDPDPTVRKKWVRKTDFYQEWTGVALLFEPDVSYQPITEKKESLFNFLPVLLKQRGVVGKIILASLIVMLIDILGSYYFQLLIDSYIPHQLLTSLTIVSLGLLAVYGIQQMLSFIQNSLLVVLGQRMTVAIILNYLHHVFELPMAFFATRKTGEIVSRFNDANKIIDALASMIISLFLDIWITILLGVVLAIQSWQLFWLTLLSLPLYTIIILAFIKLFQKYNQKTMQSNAMLSSTIIENINGIETIKALNGEAKGYAKIQHEFDAYLRNGLIYSKLDFLQQGLKNGVRLALNVVILWLGARLVIHNQLTVGQLIAYSALLSYFVNPLQNIINLQTKLQSAKVANNRLNEVYLVQSEFKQQGSQAIIQPQALTCSHVTYRYGFGQDVLHDVNLKIKPGEKLAIVGMSGSGKSTLVKLLVNFYQPVKGQVLLGEQNIQSIDKKSLRKKINYLPQSPHLFSGTILENLKLGNRPGITLDDIKAACTFAEIKQDIEKMPLQYQTEISENGAGLSSGQRQRLTIARSLLTGADVLIFDESTSNLDTITENKIVNRLISLPNRTVIFVAHRLALAKRADKIAVLDDGRIVEYGPPQVLLRKRGMYFRLVSE